MLDAALVTLIPALAFSTATVAQAPAQTPQQAANREFIVKNYPPGAMKRGEQGKVTFQVTIEPDGSLGTCDVIESSGFAGLDNETCEIMVFNARLKPVLNEEGRAIRSTQTGFIVWRLPGNDAQVATAPTPATMPKPDQVICKRTQKTGSLVAMTKQCMTRAEWKQTEQATRDQMENLQARGNCGGGPTGEDMCMQICPTSRIDPNVQSC